MSELECNECLSDCSNPRLVQVVGCTFQGEVRRGVVLRSSMYLVNLSGWMPYLT